MPIDITYHEDRLYIEGHYYGDVVLDDILQFNLAILDIFAKTSHKKIHLLVDVKDAKMMPVSVVRAWQIAMKAARHDKLGTVVVVGMTNPFVKFLIETLAKLGRNDLRPVSSREKAYEILEKLKDTQNNSV